MEEKKLYETLERKKIPEKQKEIIKEYAGRELNKAGSLLTVLSKVKTLCYMNEWNWSSDFEMFESEEFWNNYITHLRTDLKLAVATINLHKAVYKQFLKWYFTAKLKEKIPEYLYNEKFKIVPKEMTESQLLTHEDVKKLIAACPGTQQKAIISLLFESAMRIGEMREMRIRNVKIMERYAEIEVPRGKTVGRRIVIIDSLPYILPVINNHPSKEDPDAYLWVSQTNRTFGRQLTHNAIWDYLRQCARRAGIKKSVNPHIFRHSMLTWKAKYEGFNDSDLRMFAGWTKSSNMTATYLHHDEQSVINKTLQRRGLLTEKEEEQEQKWHELEPRTCPRCQKTNQPDALFCNCGFALTQQAVQELDKIKVQEGQLHQELMNKNVGDVSKEKDLKEILWQVLRRDDILLNRLKEISQGRDRLAGMG